MEVILIGEEDLPRPHQDGLQLVVVVAYQLVTWSRVVILCDDILDMIVICLCGRAVKECILDLTERNV